MLLRRSPHSGIPKKSPGGRTPSPSSSPSPSPSRPSSHPTMPLQLQLLLLLCLAFVGHVSAQFDRTISEQESKSVVLPCPVNEEKCGKLHSLNWFKGDDRIAAMLLGDSNVTSVNKEFEDRVTVEQNPYRLVIKDLKIGDEDIYLCDTTFFIPEETCDNFNGYRVELRVLENIVPPTEVVILDAKGDRIENGSVVGPMQERQALKATCTVKNTRPQPDVGWFRGTKRLATYSPTHDLNDGLYTSTLELDWQLSREDLAQDIECRVESAAIKSTIVTKFSVDLQVRPTSILIKGVEHHTVQGSKVVLQCDIHGARPAVNLTWYNTTSTISAEENDLTEIRTKAFEKEDGTYHTQSELVFNASRFENDRVFKCEAENIVLQINREKPIASSLTLEVLYPPVVKVSPPEMVTNTSEIVLLNCEYFANPASLTQVVWYRNGDIVNVNDTDHYQGGNSENVALVIKSTDKEDVGNYSCQLSNSIGKGISEQQIDLDVQYVPVVEVLMIPEGPVKESDESNVTLFCNILEANPSVLTKVRWYANATLLKELPDCEETREDLCHIDPSKLLLESIGRGFFYNYSCEGFNAAGWGPRSEEKELMVHYEPGPATLTHFPPIAVKKKSVIFSCSVDDPGYPESNRYRWLRGGRGPLQDIVTKDWTVEPVGLDSRTNYSCYAYNEGGKGVMATVNLEVHAPPFFIKNLPQYTGVLHSTRNANLTCRIECVPRCEISWQKDGTPIEKNDTRYFVKEKYMDASPATGDFESMLSVLHFNMSNWANSKFDILADSANYTCVSTANSVGPGIRSGTYLGIEYAPINTTVANATVYVQEDTIPGRVICKSFGNPEPSYEWRFKDKTITRGSALIINTPMQRNDNGTYTCVAFNKHGKSTAETVIEVQFKPRCEIERREIDDQDTLICTAFGNPVEADFSWSIKAENETVEYLGSGDEKSFADKSFYVLQEDYAIARTYRCVANNTVGSGAFCEIEVAAGSALFIWWQEQLAWWQRWEKTTLIILVAAILGLLLAVIIICCIIICVCRRRRRQDKLHDKSSSLGEPLTEPGEYENLPFHGLQTAPNKFSTTPTNFNNNTNVVRVAPRPKRLNGSISQPSNSQQQQLQQQHHHQTLQHPHPHQQQHYCDLQQQQQQQQQQHYNHQKPGPQYSTMHHLPAPHNQDSGTHQVQYNLSNCFPKSYTEYYQQHQQHQQIQKQQLPPAMATTQQQQQKFNTNSSSNVQLLNAIEHDYQPTYAVVERVPAPPPPPVPSTALLNTNPFLAASNFRKYDATGEELHGSVSGSMQRGKKTKGVVEMDKKFYSLKFPGGGGTKVKKPAAYNGNISTPLGSTTSPTSATDSSSASKCKRHHSFAGNSHSDIDSGGKPMRLYDPPVYENVAEKCHVDAAMDMGGGSSNLHTNPNLATVQLHTHSGGGGGGSAVVQQKKKHHHRHHQQKNDPGGGGSGAEFQLMEPERLSIYRSDSGISNSSYESQLPSGLSQQQHRPSKAHKSGAGAGAGAGTLANASASGALCRKTVYINMEGQCAGLIHADSPTHVHSSYESASSTSHVGGGGGGGSALAVDPTSLSSCTSLYSSGTSGTAASLRFSRHQHQHNQAMANEITTPEDFEQYQLGHHPTHSASTLSVASSLNASGRGKCKAGPPPQYSPHETNKTLATNPFLANKRNNGGVGGGCLGNKKLRRQTISDPYAHIKRRQYDGYANAAADYDVDTNITRSHNSEAPNAHGDSCPTKSASVESAATATSAARQQQIGNSNTGFSHIKIGNGASASVSASVSASASASGEHQAQLLMPNELLLQASRLGSFATVDNLRYIPPLTPVNGPLRRPLADGGAYDCLVVRRPIRLPLRKHHTFHFQSNQTANGRLQQLRQQLQHQQREREHLEQDVGSLVYRPLALNERHAFKPISPTPAMAAAGPEEAEESEAQEQQQQQPQQQPPGTTGQLNPAASLEALELLTKTHPDFMFPRSSYPQNEPTTEEGIELSARPSSAQGTAEVEAEVEEDEDLGYSFCEEEYMVDNDNDNDDASSLQTTTAPTNTPVRSSNQESAIANATAGALKYFMTQSYREVHI
ncbi:uncharacterized protein LOC108152559 isoform X4 [Drosophila miranda]|uniref:uncharacterized protein LOC108152559 isoform X4 n=1 Tax=Drosophila miranda TaxID=7229 RepID=UPI0007E781A8|nr:uncharacterized protein LOC108152559 isoform X4 [Drosophila miranda]